MRIIAGLARGRKLHSPSGRTTRPILDALKERLFSILGDAVTAGPVWDLFAGAGSLGLEALSRGAPAAVFIERDRGTFAVLERNISELGFGDRARAVRGDATRPSRYLGDAETPPALVFIDPPFPLVESDPAQLESLLVELGPTGPVAAGRVVLRLPRRCDWAGPPPRWVVADSRDHGVNRLHILAPEA